MAIDLGTNTTRYLSVGDHADFTRPNSDSCVIALVRPASDTGYIISSGTWSDAATFTMYLFNSYNVQGTYGASTASTSSPMTANTWHLVFNRRLSNSFDVGWIDVGGSSVTKSGGAAVSTSLDGTTLNMLVDGTPDASTWGFDGIFQYLAMINGAVTDNDLIALANGAPLFTMPFARYLVEVWHAKNSSLGITGLIKGHAATKNGTGYADYDDVLPLFPGRVNRIHLSAAVGGGFQPAWALGSNAMIGM